MRIARENLILLLLVLLFSAAGMILGRLASSKFMPVPGDAHAASMYERLSVGKLDLVDDSGKTRIIIGVSSEGSPGIWFLDDAGRPRMNFGLYPEGDPFIVLNDEREQAVQIFRTFGSGHAPVLVMKSDGKDRIVFGLNPQSKEPFLTLFDPAGNKASIFGDF